MRRLILLFVVAAALLWGGGQGLYTVLRNREPVAGTCGELTLRKPEKEWLRLDDCVLDFSEGGYLGSSEKSIDSLVLPLRGAGEDTGRPGQASHIVLVTQDPELVGLFRRLQYFADTKASDEQVEAFLEQHQAVFLPRRVEGIVKFGIELKDAERTQIAGIVGKVDPDFVLLEHNARPKMGLHLALFAAGLALVAVTIVLLVRARNR